MKHEHWMWTVMVAALVPGMVASAEDAPQGKALAWIRFEKAAESYLGTPYIFLGKEEIDEEEAEDLLSMISEELRERRFAPVVRLEVDKEMPEYERQLIMRELGLESDDVYEVSGLLDLTACNLIADLPLRVHKYKSWEPVVPNPLVHEGETKDTQDIFAIIRQGDLLVHHPYDSFAASVQRLVEEAAVDDRVLAIKQTLYRTSKNSRIIEALRKAAARGKYVTAIVELKARFDEARNIEWAKDLAQASVQVYYGVKGLKTHSKVCIIVRREPHGIQRYVHFGTGNYNEATARLYSDVSFMTCDETLCGDATSFFNAITGYRYQKNFTVIAFRQYNRRNFHAGLFQFCLQRPFSRRILI